MARFEIDGIDGVMRGINTKGAKLRPLIEQALTQSAAVVEARMHKEEAESFKAPTGELGNYIHVGPVWHNEDSSAISVFVRGEGYVGKRGSPRSAGTVAAMVENKHGNPWMRRSLTGSKRRINSIINTILGPNA